MASRVLTIFGFIIGVMISWTAAAQSATFTFDNDIALNMVRGEIHAPIETTRFQDPAVSGELKVDLADLKQTRGTIKVDLAEILAHSFSDPEKNSKQTEHMKNWFEIGSDVSKETRAKNRYAVFEIKEILSAKPKSVKAASATKDEIGTAYPIKIQAQGELTVHQITKSKTVDLDVMIYEIDPAGKRYPEARRLLIIRTASLIPVSLKEHDVKPRDVTGKFVATALSIIGLKIADTAKVTLDLRAVETKSE